MQTVLKVFDFILLEAAFLLSGVQEFTALSSLLLLKLCKYWVLWHCWVDMQSFHAISLAAYYHKGGLFREKYLFVLIVMVMYSKVL